MKRDAGRKGEPQDGPETRKVAKAPTVQDGEKEVLRERGIEGEIARERQRQNGT